MLSEYTMYLFISKKKSTQCIKMYCIVLYWTLLSIPYG